MALRQDQLTALADILGVSTDYLVGRESSKARGNGPTGKARSLFGVVSKLPHTQQEKVFAILEPFVTQHAGSRLFLLAASAAAAFSATRVPAGACGTRPVRTAAKVRRSTTH